MDITVYTDLYYITLGTIWLCFSYLLLWIMGEGENAEFGRQNSELWEVCRARSLNAPWNNTMGLFTARLLPPLLKRGTAGAIAGRSCGGGILLTWLYGIPPVNPWQPPRIDCPPFCMGGKCVPHCSLKRPRTFIRSLCGRTPFAPTAHSASYSNRISPWPRVPRARTAHPRLRETAASAWRSALHSE